MAVPKSVRDVPHVRVVDEAVEGDEDPVSSHTDEADDPHDPEDEGEDVTDLLEPTLAPGDDDVEVGVHDDSRPTGPTEFTEPRQARGRHWIAAALALGVAVVELVVALQLGPVAGGALPAVLLAGAAATLVGAALVAVRRARWPRRVLVVAGTLTVAGVASWVGANSATADWFGHQVSHGPRDRPRVALTFDDGPNDTATEQIARLLDAAGTKGTFFLVGKAATRRPDIVQFLVADGQLVGNHSQHHDETRWLDPRYLELGRAQRSISAAGGVCPAWYRAPHGQHTPFTAHVVASAGLTMVGWDVSAGDWLAQDPLRWPTGS